MMKISFCLLFAFSLASCALLEKRGNFNLDDPVNVFMFAMLGNIFNSTDAVALCEGNGQCPMGGELPKEQEQVHFLKPFTQSTSRDLPQTHDP